MMTSIAECKRVFVDTSAWIALMNRRDLHHDVAVACHQALPQSALRIITWGVLSETYTWLRYHTSLSMGQRWLQAVHDLETQQRLVTVYPSAGGEVGAQKLISRYSEHELSYVDATTLFLCQSRGDIDAMFAFDQHLQLAGLPLLSNLLNE